MPVRHDVWQLCQLCLLCLLCQQLNQGGLAWMNVLYSSYRCTREGSSCKLGASRTYSRSAHRLRGCVGRWGKGRGTAG